MPGRDRTSSRHDKPPGRGQGAVEFLMGDGSLDVQSRDLNRIPRLVEFGFWPKFSIGGNQADDDNKAEHQSVHRQIFGTLIARLSRPMRLSGRKAQKGHKRLRDKTLGPDLRAEPDDLLSKNLNESCQRKWLLPQRVETGVTPERRVRVRTGLRSAGARTDGRPRMGVTEIETLRAGTCSSRGGAGPGHSLRRGGRCRGPGVRWAGNASAVSGSGNALSVRTAALTWRRPHEERASETDDSPSMNPLLDTEDPAIYSLRTATPGRAGASRLPPSTFARPRAATSLA